MKNKNKFYLSGHFSYLTDTGKVRISNEDCVGAYVNEKGNVLLVVCDGMGGAKRGEIASTIAIKTLSDSFIKKGHFFNVVTAANWMNKIIRLANKQIFNEATNNKNFEGMGTTLTAVLIIKNKMIVAQVGDSRAYKIDDGKMVQLTEDQTFVSYLYKTGKIKKEEMTTHPKRHVLMNALGIFPTASTEINVLAYNNETLLVCSDGLYNNVDEQNIKAILKNDNQTEQKCNELISLANANGGSDNIAVVIWEAQK